MAEGAGGAGAGFPWAATAANDIGRRAITAYSRYQTVKIAVLQPRCTASAAHTVQAEVRRTHDVEETKRKKRRSGRAACRSSHAS